MKHEVLITTPEDRAVRDQTIFELSGGIMPDPRHFVPAEETRELIRGVRDGNADMMVRLVATRLVWMYDTYAEQPKVKGRRDIAKEDILQIGSLATLEAARKLNPLGPTAVDQLHNDIPSLMDSMLLHGKLLPSVHENGRKLYTLGVNKDPTLLIDKVKLLGEREAVVALGAEDIGTVPPETAEDAAEKALLLDEIDKEITGLNERHRYIVRARLGIGMRPLTLRALGDELGVTKQAVSAIEQRSIRKIRKKVRHLLD